MIDWAKKSVVLSALIFASCFCYAEDYYEKALQSFYNKKSNDALIYLKNALKENSQHLPSKLLLSKIYLEKEDAYAALETLNEALNMGADGNLTTYGFAKAYLMTGDFEKVIQLDLDILDNQNSFDKEIYDYNKQIFELETENERKEMCVGNSQERKRGGKQPKGRGRIN